MKNAMRLLRMKVNKRDDRLHVDDDARAILKILTEPDGASRAAHTHEEVVHCQAEVVYGDVSRTAHGPEETVVQGQAADDQSGDTLSEERAKPTTPSIAPEVGRDAART